MPANHFGVVIGISHYPGISNLHGPVIDARAFHDWLVDPEGGQVPESNVELITTPAAGIPFPDAYDARPIKREIDRALERLNIQAKSIKDNPQRWRDSRLYFYVAGHGIMPGRGETALLLADARTGMYSNLELRSYLDWYRRCGLFQEVVVFADCCRNSVSQVEPSPVPFSNCARPELQVFTLVGYAAALGKPAYEEVEMSLPADERRGYFTKALIDGLSGGARDDPDFEAITAGTLAQYVAAAVADATRNKPVPQQVEMPADLVRPIILGNRKAEWACTVTIRFPIGWTRPVEIPFHNGQRAAHDPAAGPWTINLQPGVYGVVLPGTFDGSPFAGKGLFAITGGSCDVQL
ncbi:hypothetical protein AS594_39515 [Streptomyces agglomeratus]|uniref:Peptidase C14 caspase domain-containing protein n=1 Tax=Streptomyces agglomeratus TaxID=285458 RepID=A0A1E5NZB1_9ACTN|nr:caspase family protein [Streptomyces agglomeratus]OEJ21618.1 hypothetical protein AS594_39515 [Streptomyces agglomeratus]